MDLWREKEMRPWIVGWLKDGGYDAAHECYSFWNCDVVGYRFVEQEGRRVPDLERVICIELKRIDFNGVINQCLWHRLRGNEVYAAMPSDVVERAKFTTHARFIETGIGLLSVSPEEVLIRHRSLSYANEINRYKKVLWAWKRGKRGKGRC